MLACAAAMLFAPAARAHDEPADVQPVGETVVRAHRHRPARAASDRTIESSTIAAAPRRTPEDVLRLVPGLLITQHGAEGKGHQIFLRGFDAVHGSDVEVLVGGIPINEASNVHGQGYLDLAFIIPEAIGLMTVQKSAFALEQGNFATAGTVRFDLGVARPDRGTRVGYEVGTTNRHRLLLLHAPADAPSDTFVALEAMRDDGFGENRAASRISALGQARLLRGAVPGRLTAIGSVYAARFGEPGAVPLRDVQDGDLGFLDVYSDDTDGSSERAIGGLRWNAPLLGGALETTTWVGARRLDLQENFTGALLYPEHGDRREQFQEALDAGTRGHFDRFVHPTLAIVLGAGWQGTAIRQHEDQIDADHVAWQTNRDLAIHQDQGFGFAGLRWDPIRQIHFDGGMRLDAFAAEVSNRQTGELSRGATVQLSPRIRGQVHVAPALDVFAAYGRGLRAPEARAFAGPPSGTENVRHEEYTGGTAHFTSADTAEIGLSARPRADVQASVAAFGTWIANESVYDHVSGLNLELNATRRVGVEVGVELDPLPWLELRADGTAVDARFVESGRPVPGAPTLFGTLQATVQHASGVHGGARLMALGPRPLAYGATAGSTAILDLGAGIRRGPVQVDLHVDNALGADWREGEFNFASSFDDTASGSKVPTIHYSAGTPRALRVGLTLWL
jgi:hypothetical protein